MIIFLHSAFPDERLNIQSAFSGESDEPPPKTKIIPTILPSQKSFHFRRRQFDLLVFIRKTDKRYILKILLILSKNYFFKPSSFC